MKWFQESAINGCHTKSRTSCIYVCIIYIYVNVKRISFCQNEAANVNHTSETLLDLSFGCQKVNRRFRTVRRVLVENHQKKKRPDIICKEISRKGATVKTASYFLRPVSRGQFSAFSRNFNATLLAA